jgi:hypothetical protein
MFGHDENTKSGSDNSFGSSDSDKDEDTSPAFISSSPGLDSDDIKPTEPQATSAPSISPNTSKMNMGGGDLLGIKQSALQQLTPLVGHLDQTPEEKFRTTMMMIQASDNQDLVKEAYEAAQAITDEKVKAQALLDIVNEINYFTQHKS